MIFTPTGLDGAFVVEIEPRGDDRGFFARAYCRREFEKNGLQVDFVQANTAFSKEKGTLRGMHFQRSPHAEAKFLRCVRGAVFDVMIDLRPDSPTRKKWFGVDLTAENRKMVYAPAGFAHGYLTTAADTEVFYLVSAFYAPEAEGGVRWDDPAFDIEWPLTADLHISEKDRHWPRFSG
ncbi:MAG: dTDP-4-dehydrorhamnose 3,5-epimerase [Desulfobacterales bacterium]